jgi:hypothetical protein
MPILRILCILFFVALARIPQAYATDDPVFYPVGGGFFVNKGYVLTHSDTIENCSQIFLYGAVNGAEAFLASDTTKQPLALLQTDQSPEVSAVFRSESLPPRLGNPVVLFGYKLDSSGHSIMTTKKSQIAGKHIVKDNYKSVLFDVVSTPGIYGGPLLDSSGNVVGVVAPEKQKKAFSRVYKSGSKNVDSSSSAVSDFLARQFLSQNRIPFLEADSSFYYEPELIASNARKYMVHIRCTYLNEADAAQGKKKKQ